MDLAQVERFILVLSRAAGIVGFAPFYNVRLIPIRSKVLLSFALAVALYPSSLELDFTPTEEIWKLAWMILRECGIGLALGLATYMVFAGIQLAGELVGLQMGFRIAGAFDPQFGMSSSLMTQFNNLFALMIFLSVNGHHWFIRGAAQSFQLIPLGEMRVSGRYVGRLIELFGELFVIALKIGAPMIIALILTNMALGLMMRAVPQMNIFVIGFPVMIVVGLSILLVSIEALAYLMVSLFKQMQKDMVVLMEAIR